MSPAVEALLTDALSSAVAGRAVVMSDAAVTTGLRQGGWTAQVIGADAPLAEGLDLILWDAAMAPVTHPAAHIARCLAALGPEGKLLLCLPDGETPDAQGEIPAGWSTTAVQRLMAAAGLSRADIQHLHLHGCHLLRAGRNALQTAAATALPWPRALPSPRSGDQRMRIAFFVPWITKGRGGTENVGQMMANAMAERGHAVEVFTFDDDRQPSRFPMHPGIALTYLSEADNAGTDFQMAMEVARFGPDLVVGLHMNRTFARYVRCARRLSLPLVLSEHIDPRFPARAKSFSGAEREIVMSGASRIHLLVEAFRSSLPDLLQDRIRVIPNTVPEPAQLAQPGTPTGPRRLLTVARLVPRKNIATLVRVFARLAPQVPDWTLQIVGHGPDATSLRQMADKLAPHAQVEFVGHQEDVDAYYAKAHLFVLPSLFEGFPMSTLEAMSHGLPIVGYRVCNGVNVQVVHGETGLLSCGGSNEGSLGADLLTLMRDDAARARMGAAALARFRAQFAPARIHADWEALFAEAVAVGPIAGRPSRGAYLAAKLDDLTWGEKQMITAIL